MRIVLISPTYNERENVGPVIEALEEVFKKTPQHDLHILIVDGNSPDGTAEVVREKAQKYPNVHLFLEKKKAGLGAAYLFGMDEAFNRMGADAILEFDCDFSHDPQKVPEFLAKLEEGADIVIGARYMKGGSIPTDWGWHRKLLSVCGNLFIRVMMLRLDVYDWTTGYRGVKKWLYEAIKDEMTDFRGYTFQISFLHKSLQHGAKVGQVPINFVDRKYGQSKMGPEYIKNALLFVVRTRLTDLWRWQFFRVCLVGGVGFVVQTILFWFLKWVGHFSSTLAVVVSGEAAIASNFILNNLWTFRDRRLEGGQILPKFIQFNFVSCGSLIIQGATMFFGERIIGQGFWATNALLITGILLGLVWNFTLYKKVIWKNSRVEPAPGPEAESTK